MASLRLMVGNPAVTTAVRRHGKARRRPELTTIPPIHLHCLIWLDERLMLKLISDRDLGGDQSPTTVRRVSLKGSRAGSPFSIPDRNEIVMGAAKFVIELLLALCRQSSEQLSESPVLEMCSGAV